MLVTDAANQTAMGAMANAEQQIAQANLNQTVEEFYRQQGYDEQQARFLADCFMVSKLRQHQTKAAATVVAALAAGWAMRHPQA